LPSSCKFKVAFEKTNENDILVVGEADFEAIVAVSIQANNPLCVFQSSVTFRVSTQKYTATENVDYQGVNNLGITLNKNNLRQEVKIRIVNDDLIEPYEFFTLNIISLPSEYGTNMKKVIYIEDNDYYTGSKTDIFDIFEYETAIQDINPIFYDYYDTSFSSPITMQNPQAVFSNQFNHYYFENQFGISSNRDKLKILFEFIGIYYYSIYTIEVHNPSLCNLKSMNAQRLSPYETPLEKYLNSIYLNKRAIIDINYLKYLNGPTGIVDDFGFLEVNFLSTLENLSLSNCSIRVFAEEY
jgi:hypothetical protein